VSSAAKPRCRRDVFVGYALALEESSLALPDADA